MGTCLSTKETSSSSPARRNSADNNTAESPSNTNTKVVVTTLDEAERSDLPSRPSTDVEHLSNTLTSDRSNSAVWNMNNIEHKVEHSPIITRLDLDLRESRLQFQLKMLEREAEEKFEKERIEQIRDDVLEQQIQNQQAQHFFTLRQVFDKYIINKDRPVLDAEGLAHAMANFGMVIDFSKELQSMIFKKFDLDEELEIGYMDFSAGMSHLITSPDDDMLTMLFEIYDFDQDGYLDQADVARILLTKNHFGVVQDIGKSPETDKMQPKLYTKRQCLKKARQLMEPYVSESNAGRMSFDQFKAMNRGKTDRDMMLKFMDKPSNSYVLAKPTLSGHIDLPEPLPEQESPT